MSAGHTEHERVRSDADKFVMAMLIASADNEGEIIAGDDGYYVYWPKGSGSGALSAWVLRALADELDRRNASWDEHLKTHLAAEVIAKATGAA